MSNIKITGDSIEFVGSLEDFKKEISEKFSKRNGSAKKVAQEHKVTIKTLYNWAHKYDTYKPMGNRTYTIIQKIKLVMAYDSLSEDEKGKFLRMKGLYDEDLFNWKSEIDRLEDLPSPDPTEYAQVRAIKSDLKRTKKMLNQKCDEIRKKEKELREAKAIIELKKKVEILFGKKDEE